MQTPEWDILCMPGIHSTVDLDMHWGPNMNTSGTVIIFLLTEIKDVSRQLHVN